MEALWEMVCSYLNGFEGRICDVLPEEIGKNRPCAGIFVQSGMKEKAYLDGSVCLRIPFMLCLRINAYSVREKLDGLGSLMGFLRYVRTVPCRGVFEGGRIVGIHGTDIPYRSAVFDDGGEEFKMVFSVDVWLDSLVFGLTEKEDVDEH